MTTIGHPEKTSQLFVEFKYGDPAAYTFARYTDWTMDTTYQSQTYTSTPDMEVRGIQVSGVLNDTPVEIQLPLVAAGFTDRIVNGEPHSPVYVTIVERLYSTAGEPVDTLTLFRGRVIAGARNAGGQASRVRLQASGIKQRIEQAILGIPANHQCPWTFGGRGCYVVVPTENGTVTVISGKTVTITGLAAHVDRYWHRGFLERQGIRIGIRDWLSGTTFDLMQAPPADWLNQTVKVYAGCDKSIETCRTIWANEAKFGGFGYKIPNYHPVFEIV